MREQRTPERLRVHYEVERSLADRLRGASPAERMQLYTAVYDELFQRIPDHPQLTGRQSPPERQRAAARELSRLRPYLKADTTFLEVGAGDCALSLLVAGLVQQVYAVDVSAEITRRTSVPENFQLVLSDGCSVPVPPGRVSVAYSNQLTEHLHPDDAARQLGNICAALAPGGRYLCLTPNRLTGPHDISKYFDAVATGFHLKEYTTAELSTQFKRAGFARAGLWLSAGGRALTLPIFPIVWLETVLAALPAALRRKVCGLAPIRWLLGIRLVGVK